MKMVDIALNVAIVFSCGCWAGWVFGWTTGFKEGNALGLQYGRVLGRIDALKDKR